LSTAFEYSTGQAVVVRFSEDVGPSIAAQDLALQNLTTGLTIPAAAMHVDWDPNLLQARWTFPGYPAGLPDGNYRATVMASGVSDLAGNSLAAEVSFDFFALAGDANHDRKVDFDDLVILAQNYNTTGKTFATADFNYDTKVDFEDLVLLAQRYNTTLPAPLSAPAASAELRSSQPRKPAPRFNALRPVAPAPRPPKRS
jgi:hypothetical protein